MELLMKTHLNVKSSSTLRIIFLPSFRASTALFSLMDKLVLVSICLSLLFCTFLLCIISQRHFSKKKALINERLTWFLGKTHTMFGSDWENVLFKNNGNVANIQNTFIGDLDFDGNHTGLIPRSIHRLFNEIQNEENKSQNFVVYCSFLQIYNEKVFDLLSVSKNCWELCVKYNRTNTQQTRLIFVKTRSTEFMSKVLLNIVSQISMNVSCWCKGVKRIDLSDIPPTMSRVVDHIPSFNWLWNQQKQITQESYR